VIARYLHHRAPRRSRRHAERISRSLNDERREFDCVEFPKTTLGRRCAGTARGLERECKANNSGGARCLGGAARDSRARGAPTAHERETTELVATQVVEHRHPGGVQVMRRRRRTPTRDSVGLLDENDAQSLRLRGARCGP
jgi:hypothetical protein